MRHILTTTICALMLAGCAATYDGTAMPKAAAELRVATAGCKARWTTREFTTYSQWQACQLSAERGFATTIALTRMDAFDVYASNLQALAADRDAHRVTDRQVMARGNRIEQRFFADCRCAQHKARFTGGAGQGLGSSNYAPDPSYTSPRARELSGT